MTAALTDMSPQGLRFYVTRLEHRLVELEQQQPDPNADVPTVLQAALRTGRRGHAVPVEVDGTPVVVLLGSDGTGPNLVAEAQVWEAVREFFHRTRQQIEAHAPAGHDGFPLVRRADLPREVDALVWHQDGYRIVLATTRPGRAALHRALRLAGHQHTHHQERTTDA